MIINIRNKVLIFLNILKLEPKKSSVESQNQCVLCECDHSVTTKQTKPNYNTQERKLSERMEIKKN